MEGEGDEIKSKQASKRDGTLSQFLVAQLMDPCFFAAVVAADYE